MFNAPKTEEQTKEYRYGKWAGNPKGSRYIEGRCAYEVPKGTKFYQCGRKNGHGPEGLYCWHHAKRIR